MLSKLVGKLSCNMYVKNDSSWKINGQANRITYSIFKTLLKCLESRYPNTMHLVVRLEKKRSLSKNNLVSSLFSNFIFIFLCCVCMIQLTSLIFEIGLEANEAH